MAKMLRPLCAQCRVERVKRDGYRYCSKRCANLGVRKPRPLCRQCGKTCPTRKQVYCSSACFGASERVVQHICACGCRQPVKRKRSKYFSRRCAWLARKGWEMSARGRANAWTVRRRKYAARLRERLKGMTSAGQIWQAGYAQGYGTAHQSWRRRVLKGEVVILKPRRAQGVA